jgi:polyhydroxyalkanoate synthesis repressor PhaR
MAERTDAAPKHLQIKKYANRRYYDATHSRHLTLSEIRSLIQQGCEITVTDGKTGADITAQVLTQIILEMETAKLDSFPVPLLLRVIRLNDQLVKDFIEKYFNQALESFLVYQQQIEDQIRRTHGLPASFPSVSAWTKAVLAPFASPLAYPLADKSSESPPSPRPADHSQELRQMLRKLQKQVASLKKSKTHVRGKTPGRRRPAQ